MTRKLLLAWILCAGFVFATSLAINPRAQAADESAETQIRSVLDLQSSAWNRGDIASVHGGILEITGDRICRGERDHQGLASRPRSLSPELSGWESHG